MIDTKILIVEDEAIVALDLQGWLRRLGYPSTITAMTGDEAIEFADVMRPDLIFMDIGLKGDIDGIQVAEQILAHFAVAMPVHPLKKPLASQ
jgi:CheY-like chemotaxis protein